MEAKRLAKLYKEIEEMKAAKSRTHRMTQHTLQDVEKMGSEKYSDSRAVLSLKRLLPKNWL